MNCSPVPSVRTAFGACLLAGTLLLPALMHAQLDRSQPPVPGPPPVVHLGEHSSFLLANGMRVIVVENHKLPLVSVQVRIDIPPIAQGELTGYVDLVGDLLATGTANRSKAEIDEQVDRLGATLFAASDGLYANGLKKNLPALMDIVQEVITAPTFTDAEFDKAVTRFRSGTQQRKEDPDSIAEAVGRAATFGSNHPYGEVASERTLSNITAAHVRAFYSHFFQPEKAYLVFVGDITEKEARKLAKNAFGEWTPAKPSITVDEHGREVSDHLGTLRYVGEPSTAKGLRRVVFVDRPGSAQSVIRVTYPLNLEPRDTRAMAAQVMNTILGGGVFNARLMQNLREDKAWTYGAYSSIDPDRYNASFTASVSVRNNVTDSAIVEILAELDRMRTEGVTPEELELAKNYMAGSFARSLEDPRTVARFALNTYLNGLAPGHYASYLDRLAAITAADVQAAAQAFLLPDNAVLFVVGDKREVYRDLIPLSNDTNNPVQELTVDGEPWKEVLIPVADRTPEKVVADHIYAIGGRAAVAKLTDVCLVMATEVSGGPATLTQWFGSGGRFRSEWKVGDTVVREEICDGARAMRRTAEGEEELFDIDLADLRFNGTPVPEYDLTPHVERMYLSGLTVRDAVNLYKLTVFTNHGTSVEDYYHVETGLKVRRVERKYMMGRSQTVETIYRDHRAVGGVLLPHTIEQFGGVHGPQVFTLVRATLITAHPKDFFVVDLPEPTVDPVEPWMLPPEE